MSLEVQKRFFLLNTFTFFLLLSAYAEDDLFQILKKSQISGYAKMMYINNDRIAPKLDQSTFGIGGKIELDTAYWNSFKAKVAYYQTSDLGLRSSDPKKTDAYMFDVNKVPYRTLGEAVLEYKDDRFVLLFGRQPIDTPIVSTYDYRIIPNLFEAYTLTVAATPYTQITLSYISKMSGLDGLVSFKNFKSMSQQTYTSLAMVDMQRVDSNDGDTIDISRLSGNQGVIMSGIVYDNDIKIQGWNYYCQDVVDEFYTDIAFPSTITTGIVSTFGVQAYGVRDVGHFKDFLHTLGLNGSYELYGIKLSLENKKIGVATYVAYNFFTGDSQTVTAFGNWGGYPEYVTVPYMFAQDDAVSAIAKSQMGKINFKFDLSYVGLPQQTLITGYSYIDLHETIMPNSDIAVVNLVYKVNISDALWFKAQYEWRDSNNYRYANDMLTLSATYTF